MSKKPFALGLFLGLFFFVSPLYALTWKSEPKIQTLFKNHHITGTFVLYNGTTWTGYNSARAHRQYIPASTYKIPHSLIALQTGAVNNVDEVFFHYDGKPLDIKAWEKDMNLREAIAVSNVAAYQQIARKIGLKTMRMEIQKLQYGNMSIGRVVDRFWLQGPLKISAIEQTQFLDRLAHQKLPYPANIQTAVKGILLLESTPHYKLYGKTGLLSQKALGKPNIGWFVGWVEKNQQIYPFALNINMTPRIALDERVQLVKESLRALGLLS